MNEAGALRVDCTIALATSPGVTELVQGELICLTEAEAQLLMSIDLNGS